MGESTASQWTTRHRREQRHSYVLLGRSERFLVVVCLFVCFCVRNYSLRLIDRSFHLLCLSLALPTSQRVVEADGEFIVDTLEGKTLRVSGEKTQLAITRALGDFEFGEIVTATPHISVVDLTSLPPPSESQSNLLVLACDGIWDVLSDEEAIQIARRHDGDLTSVAVWLRDYAYLRDSADDLTVICVNLDE